MNIVYVEVLRANACRWLHVWVVWNGILKGENCLTLSRPQWSCVHLKLDSLAQLTKLAPRRGLNQLKIQAVDWASFFLRLFCKLPGLTRGLNSSLAWLYTLGPFETVRLFFYKASGKFNVVFHRVSLCLSRARHPSRRSDATLFTDCFRESGKFKQSNKSNSKARTNEEVYQW